MYGLKIVQALGPIDAKNVRRDSFLRWMILIPVLVAVLTRWGLPNLVTRLQQFAGVELMPYYSVIMGYCLLLLTPAISGMVIGFLLLDQRDDGTLTALQVTPMPMNIYLAYRLALPMLLSFLCTLVAFPIAGLNDVSMLMLLLAALAAAPLAPLIALALAAFAENKVQGFALMKASGILQIAPVVAYFVPSQWQVLFGSIPNYWPAKLYWLAQAGNAHAWIYLPTALAYQALLLLALLRRFNRFTRA